MLRGQQGDKTVVWMVLAIGNMGVDVTEAVRRRPEKHMGLPWGRC
jgi:hypothetical protein